MYDNGDWVHFDVTQWVPVVASSGIVAHDPVTENDRVAFQVDRGTQFYGNTRSWPRYVYPEGIKAHDYDMRKPGRHGLTRKPMRVTKRALRVLLNEVRYSGPLLRLVMAEYPNFEDFVEMYGFVAYQARPDAVFSRRTLERLRIIGGLSLPPVLLLLKSTVRERQGLTVGTQDLSLLQMLRWRGTPAHNVSQP